MKIMRGLIQKARVYCTVSIVILFVFSGCDIESSRIDRSFTEKADEYIQVLNETCTGQKINGNILVAKDGEILLNKGYGKEDYDKNNRHQT